MEEKIAHVDEQDNLIDYKPRSEFLKSTMIHRTVWVLLFNSLWQMLIQKRAMSKTESPGLRSSSVSWGVGEEWYKEAAIRETKEELGIDVEVRKLFKFRRGREVNDYFKEVYIAKYDGELNIQKEEVAQVLRADVEDIVDDVERNPHKYTTGFKKLLQLYLNDGYKEKESPNQG